MHLQTTVYSIIIITVFLAIVLVIINRKLRNFDPLSKPKGIVLLIMMATETIDKIVKEKTNEEFLRNLSQNFLNNLSSS